mgnify:FL=1
MIVFWPECSKDIGMGHLAECLALADHAKKAKRKTCFILSNFEPAVNQVKAKGFPYLVSESPKIYDTLRNHDLVSLIALLVINRRTVQLEKLNDFRKNGLPIAIIDQLGNKAISCDLLINSSIVPDWHSYEFIGPKPICCIGSKYAIIRDEFKIQKNKREKSNRRKVLLVTMGGIDRTRSTLRILQAISNIREKFETKFIIGHGFLYKDKFMDEYERCKNDYMRYFLNVNNIAEHISSSDLVLSAGGNTMYEIAYLGKPSLVLWEDPHEKKLSETFESLRCSGVIGNGESSSLEVIRNRIEDLMADDNARKDMSKNALRILDGSGPSRIFDQIDKVSLN